MSNYSSAVLNLPSLAVYWRLGSSGGTDSSGNSRTGTAAGGVTIGGATTLITGDADAATDFDGTDDRITSTYNPWGNTSLSFGIWVSRDTSTTDDTFIGGDLTDSPHLKLYSGSDTVAWSTNRQSVGDVTWGSSGIANTTTTFVGFTFNDTSNVAELFVNGVSKGTASQTGAYHASPGNIEVGCEGAPAAPFDGKLDEFFACTTILTAAQFRNLYNVGKNLIAVPRRPRPKFVSSLATGAGYR